MSSWPWSGTAVPRSGECKNGAPMAGGEADESQALRPQINLALSCSLD